MSKKDYLFAFNSSLYRPLHVQPFVFNHIKAFHSELAQLQQQHCRNCRELWPTRKAVAEPFICDRCQKHFDFNPFGIQNYMCAIFQVFPSTFRLIYVNSQPQKKCFFLLLYLYVILQAAYGWKHCTRLRSQLPPRCCYIHQGDSSNCFQLPNMIIRRRGVDNGDFKVCQKRVEQVGRFFIQNHPGFTHHENTFSHLYTTHFDGSVFFLLLASIFYAVDTIS